MNIKGHVHYDSSTGSFQVVAWVEDSGAVVTTSLGSMSYQLYNRAGTQITATGASEVGISPLANGLFCSTQVSNPSFLTNRESFLILVTIPVGVDTLTTYLPFSIYTI